MSEPYDLERPLTDEEMATYNAIGDSARDGTAEGEEDNDA